jgi:regulator of sigma E protease
MGTTLVATLIMLSVLILIHELGHLIAAKGLGIRVLRFSIGFGPKLLGVEAGGTEYRLSALPFGGYVRMVGDDGLDEPDATVEEGARFSSKPVWVRSVVVLSGPLSNLIFAFAVIFGVIYIVGIDTYEPMIGHIEEGSPAAAADLRPGDRIVTVDGRDAHFWSDLVDAVVGSDGSKIVLAIDRDDQRIDAVLVPLYDEDEERWRIGVGPWVGTEVGGVRRGSPAAGAGIREGDRILRIGGERVGLWYDLVERISANPEIPVTVEWERGGELMSAVIVPELVRSSGPEGETVEVGVLGVLAKQLRRRVSLIGALSTAVKQIWWIVRVIVTFLSMLVRGEVGSDSVSGPVWIGYLAGETARYGARSFLEFMAFLSANLALLNLLPLPVLDGGQLVFFGIELARGSPLSLRRRLLIQQVGFLLIIAIFFYVTYHDILRLVRQFHP